MLPLISNALPPTPVATTTSAVSFVLAGSADAGAASRQLLQSAVIATGAPAAYFSNTPQQRAAASSNDRTIRVAVPPPTGDFVEVQQPAVQTAAAARFSVPVTLGIPLTTQLNAQFIAQQAASPSPQVDPFAAPREEKPQPAAKKDAPFGSAKGANAYSIAAARSATIDIKAEIEPA